MFLSYSPLHHAASSENWFSCGADSMLNAKSGETALELDCQNGAEAGHIPALDWFTTQGLEFYFRLMTQEKFSYQRG